MSDTNGGVKLPKWAWTIVASTFAAIAIGGVSWCSWMTLSILDLRTSMATNTTRTEIFLEGRNQLVEEVQLLRQNVASIQTAQEFQAQRTDRIETKVDVILDRLGKDSDKL